MRFSIILFLLFVFTLQGQEFKYAIEIDTVAIPQMGGIQSFSVGQWNGYWLIVGGRLDGIHRRQPWASFDEAGHNRDLIVLSPELKKVWKSSLSTFPLDLQEQLGSSNIQFIQKDSTLYLAGGYGISKQKDDHTTFPFLTIVNIPKAISMIVAGQEPSVAFKQYRDERFALTGGQLTLMDDWFYLVGGHNFEGRYNPMDNPTFTQTYSCEVRRFMIENKVGETQISWKEAIRDENLMHRRDFNVLPQIQDGTQSLVAFSGVFQREMNIPYLDAVNIDRDHIHEIPAFAQYYNHYHCATIALHDPEANNMYNLFFGGIAHYYDSLGMLVQDNDVPFTPAISVVQIEGGHQLKEFQLPVKLPGYFGAASEFIPNLELRTYSNEVIDLSAINDRRVLLGHILGGIQSSAANVFWVTEGEGSIASSVLFPVYLTKVDKSVAVINEQSRNGLQLQVMTDPVEQTLSLGFHLLVQTDVLISLTKNNKVIWKKNLKKLEPGQISKNLKCKKFKRGDVLELNFTSINYSVKQILVVR